MGAARTHRNMPGSPRRSRAKATSSPGSITIAPTLTTRASLTSPTRSGSGRATSRRLLKDPVWGNAIDAQRICVAGHSQGGFTSLWIGGAKVNADKFLAFQQGWKNNQQIPAYLRNELPLDPAPALDVRDPRIKAAFAMAPGIIKAFGMDEAGLRQMTIPAYITVGARDTQTPPQDNAAFAAANIPDAKLVIIPGLVDHEIFINECDDEGRDEFPEACIDAPGVDRHAIHRDIGAAALTFFDAHLPSEGEK
jgi:predicted dienelactone hydrolase